MFYYSLKDVKRRFNHSQVTKVSAKTFAKGCKKPIRLEKTLYRFPDFIDRKYFTLIMKTMILTGKFCYRHGNFHNKEAATGCALKIQIKFPQNSRENTFASVFF